MFVDLDVQEQGVRFQFFGSHIDPVSGDVVYEEPKGDAWVEVRPMGPFIEQRVMDRKRKSDFVYNPKSKSMDRVTYITEPSPEELKQEREDTWDYVIVNFGGFKNKKTGEEIECTRASKINLMKLPVFDRFIGRCQQLLAESGIQESEVKNSQTGLSGETM